MRVDLATEQTLWRRSVNPTRTCLHLHLVPGALLACGSYEGAALVDLETGETVDGGAPLQTAFLPYFHTIDDESLLVSVVIPPVWMRMRIDGGNASADIVAKGRELVDGPEAGGSLAVTRPVGGGRMQLWDLERDAPVGAESDRIVPLGSGVFARYSHYDESGGVPRLERLSGEQIPLAGGGLPEKFEVAPGTWDSPAFAWWPSGVVAFDPATGEQLGPVMSVPDSDFDDVHSVSETPDGSRAIITWVDSRSDTSTAVFDIRTGELQVQGAPQVDFSLALDGDQFIGVGVD